MSVDIGTVTGTITLRDTFTTAMERAASQLVSSADKVKKVGAELSDVGGQLSRVITLPIAAIGAGAIKAATDFESSFAGVRKTVNATELEFDALESGFRDLAREIPANVNELNRVAEAAGQLGIETDSILSFTRTMIDLGNTTNLSADSAATALARLANITQMPQSEFDRLGSTIVALGNNFATTEAEIAEMGLRIAGAGAQIGLTEGEILAVATSLSSVGINAEAGGSAISKTMINMALAVSMGGDELDNFANVANMSASEFQRAFKDDAAGAVESFIIGLGNMQTSGGDVLRVLDDMGITEVRMRDALLRSAGAGDLLTRALDLQSVAWNENVALTNEAATRYATAESKLTVFWNRIKDVAITLGQALVPIMLDLLDAIDPLISLLANAARKFGELPRPIQTTVAAIAGLLAAAGPVLVIVGSLMAAWGTFAASTLGATLIPAIGSVITVLTGPVGWTIALVALLASVKPIRDAVSTLARAVADFALDTLKKVTDRTRKWWRETEDARKFLGRLVSVIKDDLIRAMSTVVDSIRTAVRWWGSSITTTKDLVLALDKVWRVSDTIKESIRLQVQQFERLWNVLGLVENRTSVFSGALTALLAGLLASNPALAAGVTQIAAWTGKAERAANIAKSQLSPALDGTATSAGDVEISMADLDRISNELFSSMGAVSGGVDEVSDRLTDVEGSADGATDKFQLFADTLSFTDFSLGVVTQGVSNFSGLMDFSAVSVDGLRQSLTDAAVSLEDTSDTTSEFDLGLNDFSTSITDVANNFREFRVVVDDTEQGLEDAGETAANSGMQMGRLGDVLAGMFEGEVSGGLQNFIGQFANGFAAARDSGETASQAVASAWQGAKGSMLGVANAIANGMAAAAGNTQDQWTAALGAILSFATGDWVSGIIQVAGIAAGFLNDDFTLEGQLEDYSRALASASADTFGFSDAVLHMASLLSQMLVDVQFNSAEGINAVVTLSQHFGTLLDAALRAGEFGARAIEEIANAAAIGGVGMEVIASHIGTVYEQLFDVIEQRNEALLTESQALVESVMALITDTGNVTQAEVQFAAMGVIQAFQAMVAAGEPISAIIAEIGPAFDAVAQHGFDAGTVLSSSEQELFDAFSDLGDMFEVLANERMQNLITRLEGIGAASQAAGNLGLLTSQQFGALGDRIRATFNQMTEGGLEGNQAIAAIAPQLQILHDLSQQYGFSIDNVTQNLIDQAEAQGLVADRGLTTEDILITGFDRMIVVLNRMIEAMGGVPVAFAAWGEQFDTTVGEISNGADTIVNDFGDVSDSVGGAGREGRDTGDVIRHMAVISGETATAITGDMETVTDRIRSVGDGYRDMEIAIDQVGTQAQSTANLVSIAWDASTQDMVESWSGATDGIKEATGEVGSTWIENAQTMVGTWTGVATGIASTAGSMASNWISDIERVGDEWRTLMDQMDNDFGGSVVADAIQVRSAELAGSMVGDILFTASAWTTSMDTIQSQSLSTADLVVADWAAVRTELEKPVKPVILPPTPVGKDINPSDDFWWEVDDDGNVIIHDNEDDDESPPPPDDDEPPLPPAAPDPRLGRGGGRGTPRGGGHDSGNRPVGMDGTGGGSGGLNLNDQEVLDRLNDIGNRLTTLVTIGNRDSTKLTDIVSATDRVNASVKGLSDRLVSIESRRRT